MKNVVVIPTYNERGNIKPLIGEIFTILPDISLLVVDDSSPDGTAQAVQELTSQYPHLALLKRDRKNGLGGAYLAAFKHLLRSPEIERVIMMDGDFSHHPRYLPSILKASEAHDLVIGSRYITGGGIAQWELWRRFLSLAANYYARSILRYPIADWTSGFNCIRADVLRKTNLESLDLSGYAFLQELKYMLVKSGASVTEVPIIFGARRGGESKISGFIIREGIIGPWKMRLKK